MDHNKQYMTQDDFVLHAVDGDANGVLVGLNEKRLCSVNGFHKDKVIFG